MKLLKVILIIVAVLVSGLSYPYLPSQMPTHWNFRGEVDAYTPKQIAVWLFPAIIVGMAGLFHILPYFDPKKGKYTLFKHEWQIIQSVLIAFFVYIHLLTLYVSIRPSISFLPLFFFGLGTLFVLMGNYLSKIRQNYFIGIRTPWTLADEDNWNKTHRFASWCFVIVGIVTLIEAYAIWYAPIIIFGGIMLSAFLPMVYSFVLFKKRPRLMRYILLGIIGLIIVVTGLRLMSGEDNWVCQNGQWVKHGQPNTPMPSHDCP